MGLISIGGLGSGLDINSIVSTLVAAERAPKENSLTRQETEATFNLTGLGQLSSALAKLKSSAEDLANTSNYNLRNISVTPSGFFTATAAEGAVTGNYDIEVTSLARGSFHESKVFTGGSSTTFGTGGTLTFTVDGNTFDVDVSGTDTLDDIRQNINDATGNAGLVSVNMLNNVTVGPDTGSVLTFSSSTTGLGKDLVVTYTGDASLADLADNLTIPTGKAAADAAITIDNFSATSSSNTFANIIQDVTITVTKVQDNPGDTETLGISLNTSKVESMVNSFVKAYNEYVAVEKELGSADPKTLGFLVGDYTLRQVSNQLKGLFSSSVSGANATYNSLSSIGIKTTKTGTLEVDSAILSKAVNGSFSEMDELFTGTNGFASQLKSLIDDYTGSSGIITSRQDALNAQLSRIADDRIALGLRIDALQVRLTKQFSTMDAIVAQMNSTQSYISQQFANLPGFGGKKD